MTSDLEECAKELATVAHGVIKQLRKYTGEPYIHHPAAVVELVRSVSHTEEMLAAAWLHDTVEDTGLSLVTIEKRCGMVVACLVEQVTDVSNPTDGNRAARKAIDRDHLAKASTEAKTIKLADLIDNTRSIVQYDPKFAKTYLAEKRDLMPVLRGGDPSLWERANRLAYSHVFASL